MGGPKTTGDGSGSGSGWPSLGANTPIAVVDAHGRILLWSPQAQALLGYPAREACGRPAVDLLATPEDRQAVAAVERQPAGKSWDGVLGMRHRDGHEVQVTLRVCPALSPEGGRGWLVMAADAHRARREAMYQGILEALFTQSPISVVVVDPELRYLWVNAEAERDIGAPAERLVGLRISDAVPHIDVEGLEATLRRVRDTGEPVIGFQVRGRTPRHPDRERAWSLSSFRLTDPAGQTLGMCLASVDVTDGYRAQRRLALVNKASARIGTTLDVTRTAQELADAAVPALADIVSVDLLEAIFQGEEPAPCPPGEQVLARRTGIRTLSEHAPEAVYAVGETVAYPCGTPQAWCLAIEKPVLVPALDTGQWFAFDTRRAEKIREFGMHSLMVVPLRARGVTLGLAGFARYRDPEPFDQEDLALAEDLASRAAVCVDNARRYTREHTTALALQRSLLPRDLPRHPAVESACCYLPAATHLHVGGGWFDVLPVSGARVALIVGKVTDHGLHAAATMGRLRTAVHTLAELDLAPEEVLTQLDALVIRLAQEDPTIEGATCLYAVYDPIAGTCTLARAGHPPPAVVHSDGAVEFLDLPPGPPLGRGGLPFETAEFHLAEGTLLALYTGLTEAGLDRLAGTLAGPGRSPDQFCEAVEAVLLPERRAEDVALLVGRTRRLGADRVASWRLQAEPALVADARALAAGQLGAWNLEPLSFTTELIVSELITNAIRHARGPIELRLIHTDVLICEVSDSSLSAPHLRRARLSDEGGRGLFLVAQLTSRWGTRYRADGKTIWAEQPLLPGGEPPVLDAAIWDTVLES
ncbi:SpoIIE family protein phosphatase [Nonomuraea phyllanthi]|uniref:SpoIIE family protein phosphatase n=1 Tax=Nonomuraea phyllanthi TaxID=2219224 RepID=A0A5C4VCX9_9ACTN|nr:SpoIIE family protein phosphatase [Nonomuraea phyllanthi]KAB8188412.1 SpoIIE family protein phosphatase [Nonomuraea phyllanthi]QFY09849.1 SpoIIE family protein phosphatase [Nonomuraea phyllanthi]